MAERLFLGLWVRQDLRILPFPSDLKGWEIAVTDISVGSHVMNGDGVIGTVWKVVDFPWPNGCTGEVGMHALVNYPPRAGTPGWRSWYLLSDLTETD